MVLLLVAGVGAGVAAGGLTTGPMRHWAERFGQHDDAQGSDLVSFNADGSDGSTSRGHGGRHRRAYDDEQGYPLEGSGEGENFAYAGQPDGPAFQHAPPPGQVVILRGPDWRYDEQESHGDAFAAPAPRQRSFAPAQQALPTRRSPTSPPIDDAAAAAAARARAAADDVTAAEHATS